MPVLEDAESVQVALMQIMRLLVAGQLDPKIAGLLLYALQTASSNLRQMKLEPYHLESVVIDLRTVGDKAWATTPGRRRNSKKRKKTTKRPKKKMKTNQEV